MTEIEVTDSKLIVHVLGMHKILALQSRLDIPLSHVVSAEVDPVVVENWGKLNWKGIRVGTSLPGVIKAGSFYTFGGEGAFWDVHNPKKAITIKLTHKVYTRLVVEVADPAATIASIEVAVRTSKSS